MSKQDWYRRTKWSEDDAVEFHARLKRSRGQFHKAQYVRIQAGYLYNAGLIEQATELLQLLFREYPDASQLAQAHVQHAECLLAFGKTEEAVIAYKSAISAEQSYPGVKTQVWLDLPWLIVTQKMRHLYSDARKLLDTHKTGIMFPVDEFRYAASLSFLADEYGDSILAAKQARNALASSQKEKSGMRYHPEIGLVGDRYSQEISRLQQIARLQ